MLLPRSKSHSTLASVAAFLRHGTSSLGGGAASPSGGILNSSAPAPRRTLAQRLIVLTVLLLVASALILAHSILVSKHLTSGTTGESSRDAQFTSVAFAATKPDADNSVDSKNPNLIDLTPPLSRTRLGHATWSLLHTMAALFPVDPSAVKQQAMHDFLHAFAELYPCATCARHFRAYLALHPLPTPLTRDSLSEWVCASHNAVNVRLGKPTHDCTPTELAKTWPPELAEDCGCSDAPDEASGTDATPIAEASSTPTSPLEGLAAPDAAAASKEPSATPLTTSAIPAKESPREEEERAQRLADKEEDRRKAAERVVASGPPQQRQSQRVARGAVSHGR